MKFSQYFFTLKNYFIAKISNEELFRLLMDSIIQPLNLTSADGDLIDFSKSRISGFVNDTRPLPSIIQENVYNEKVVDTIVDYFEQNIVSELSPNKDDLCYQIMQLINNDSSISPISKSKFKMMAKPSTIALFLAQSFPYAIRSNEAFSSIKTSALSSTSNTLELIGIHKGNILNQGFTINTFRIDNEFSIKYKLSQIKNLYTTINSILFCKPSNSIKGPLNIAYCFSTKPVSINEDMQELIEQFAKCEHISINKDFFNLGNLRESIYPSISINNNRNFEGSNDEKHKYNLIKELYDEINNYLDWYPIEKTFSTLQCASLGIRNIGDVPYQDISISLECVGNSIMTPTDIANLDFETLEKFITNYTPENYFTINRTPYYLDYQMSIRQNSKTYDTHYIPPSLFPSKLSKKELEQDLNDIFDYYFDIKDGNSILSIEFDEIMHNTTVAFPTIIFF